MRRKRALEAAWLPILVLALVGCTRGPDSADKPLQGARTSVNFVDRWVLGTDNPTAPTPALLWNGNAGIRVGRSGSPLMEDGTELPAFLISNYEKSGEERIIPLTQWFESRNAPPPFDPKAIRQYRQRLDMRTGILETEWLISDRGRRVQVRRETLIDPAGLPIWGERWTTRVATTMDLTRQRDEMILDQFSLTQYIPSSLDDGNPPSETFAEVAERAAEHWKEFWKTDIEIDGPADDQQAIRSFLFYLRTAIDPSNTHAISPMGLSNRQYFGHVFWDADVWVFPALMLLDPERAATIPDYRLRLSGAARQNYLAWVKAGRPLGRGEPMGNRPADPNAIMFPWESSISGLETVPGPSRFQHHISATVTFGLQKAAALGLVEQEKVNKVGQGVAAFYMDRAEKTETGLNLRGTMSPDEHFTGDNDLYTNAAANWVLDRFGPTGGPRFVLPRDEKGFISYEGDRFRGYKQAAAVLTIFPLQLPEAEAEANTMMGRFEKGVIENGPAMTESVHATIWARLGESQRAYETWRRSWKDFTNHPLLLFSEKRNRDITYFTTGAGGCLQTVLFGFAGIRIGTKPATGAKWSKPLKGGYFLSITPNLPAAWKSIKLKGVSILGKRYNFTLTGSDVQVEEIRDDTEPQ